MGKLQIDEEDYRAVLNRIAELEKLLKKPVASLYCRMVKGVQSGPTLVLPANLDSYSYIDGMDITADLDSAQVLIDLNMMASLSALPTSVKFQIEVDGNNDERQQVTWSPGSTSRNIYTGVFLINAMPGEHRYRAMMSSATAITVTLTDQSRYMRVTGLKYPRKG